MSESLATFRGIDLVCKDERTAAGPGRDPESDPRGRPGRCAPDRGSPRLALDADVHLSESSRGSRGRRDGDGRPYRLARRRRPDARCESRPRGRSETWPGRALGLRPGPDRPGHRPEHLSALLHGGARDGAARPPASSPADEEAMRSYASTWFSGGPKIVIRVSTRSIFRGSKGGAVISPRGSREAPIERPRCNRTRGFGDRVLNQLGGAVLGNLVVPEDRERGGGCRGKADRSPAQRARP